MRSFAIMLALCGAALAGAQTLAEYAKLRRSFGISQAVGTQTLDTLIGTRVVEIRGVVRGSFGVNGKQFVLLERADGGDHQIEAERVPDWLGGSDIVVRLLVRAHRPDENAGLRAVLLGAAPDAEVRKLEAAEAAKRPPAKAPSTGSQPNSTNPLRGPIGSSRKGAPRAWNVSAGEALPIYAEYIKRYNKRLTQQQANEIAHGILGYSVQYGVDARLIMAMVLVESGFNPNATSHAGAMGLGQLMPGTASGMGISNAYDTYQNLYGTVRKVRGHIDRYTKQTGDPFEGLVLSLAAYNAGSGAVRRHGGVPPYRETQNYIQKVISTYRRLSGQ